MAGDIDRLHRLLGGPELADLRLRLRARFERGATRDEFTLVGLAAAERRALAGLLGRPVGHADSMRMRLSDIDAALFQAGVASTLREALEALDGPIHDLKATRRTREEAWAAALKSVEHPRLKALIEDPAGGSLVRRFSAGDPKGAAQLLESVGRVIERLPEHGTPLAYLAAAELGDAHALDSGSPVATLVLRAFGLELSAVEGGESSREQWARLGITVNELAAPVLCLNLPTTGDTVTSNVARVAASSGEPVHLTLRMLLRYPPTWDVAARTVFVCENPSILSMAADRLGVDCAPLICTNGMPGATQQTLLRQLVAGGARLAYHGDFDWPGVRIGNFVLRELQAFAWRFSAEDYVAGCAGSTGTLPDDERMEAAWDARLSAEMRTRRKAIHEEAVGEILMADLSQMPDLSEPPVTKLSLD
jgi:uncharacterized protein (TIGR02679 family)